ncbi:MAG: Heat-inducible transcription repressor HrcA [Elusimicrobia bacterium ADurb.Bin231]|nr:MAG: Heat-inducible transcription repressor HrcA [Elusimicrobia bacterium ADurb.Bin231]
MDNRLKELLRVLIEIYLKDLKPVGSLQVSEKCGLSPSLIRNHLSILEKDGYLRHINVSSGRMPTAKGIRFFIMETLELLDGLSAEKQRLKEDLENQTEKIDRAFSEYSGVLFSAMKHCEYSFAPLPGKTVFKEILLMAEGKRSFSGVLISSAGPVNRFAAETQEPLDQDFLNSVKVIINMALKNIVLPDIVKEVDSFISHSVNLYPNETEFIKKYKEILFKIGYSNESSTDVLASNQERIG